QATGEPDPAATGRAEQTGEPGPAAGGAEPAAASSAEPAGDDSSQADRRTVDPPAAAQSPPGPQPESAVRAPASPTPEDVSTGPALVWTEVPIDLGAGSNDSLELLSLGDGRILALARGESGKRLALTADGTAWSSVELPGGAFPHRIAVSGDRWVIASDHWDPGTEPPTADATRVHVSDDGGETWNELGLDAEREQGLPRHCVEQSAVQDVLASGEHVVVLMSLRRLLDIEAILAERGLIAAGTPATEWRRIGDTLTVRLGDPAEWDLGDEDQVLDVELGELGLTSEQLHDCDGYASGRVVVLAGGGSAVSRVAEYEGWVSSAVATEDGFALVVVADGEVRRLTSTDGLGWVRVATGESGYGTVARGRDGSIWLGENRDGFEISRGTVDSAPRLVAAFDTLEPLGVLSAGPAGVAASAWRLPEEFRDRITATTFTKDGYELRLSADGVSLWDVAGGVAVHEFSAEQMESDEPPEGVREERGDDGSVSVAFDDPATGEELVRFTEQDLMPDTDRIVATRKELFGPTGVPPIWIGWSDDGERWGWQDAAEAFGLAAGEGLTPFTLAVGSDFVLARVNSFDVAEAMAMAESPDAEEWRAGPPSSWRVRWFIARVP
ncbi:MAG: hypothetical protein OXP08_12765, partial [bacterium]|nr:hypothetical protein [bacterium]